jgi:hypothetical protein
MLAAIGATVLSALDPPALGLSSLALVRAVVEPPTPEPSFAWPVLAVTVASFVAAGVTAWKLAHSPLPVNDPIALETNLLDPDLPMRSEPRIVEIFGTALLILVGIYLVFDRGGAWIHIPGTPAFIGEVVIVLGIAAMSATHAPIGKAIRRSPAMKALVFWMAWGGTLLVLAITRYGIDAIRDSALWYYGIAAVFVVFLLVSNPARIGRWLHIYRSVMPFLLLWYPFAIVFAVMFDAGPMIPFSEVPLASHKSGNIAVVTAIFIAYIWLVDGEAKVYTDSQRALFTGGGVLVLLLASVQNRGGMVASALGLFIAMMLMKRRKSEFGLIAGGVLVIVFTLALVSNVSIPLFGDRSISAEQIITNVSSVVDPDSGSRRETSTTEWRLDLWGRVLNDVTEDSPILGFGPGPDLGEIYGVGGKGTETLRNPHNSHVGILARMGFVGVIAWAALWTVWTIQLLLMRQRLLRRGRRAEAATGAWLVAAAAMILTNSIFDPTLEGPQVAVWLWVLFGLGAALPLLYSGFESTWLDALRTNRADSGAAR